MSKQTKEGKCRTCSSKAAKSRKQCLSCLTKASKRAKEAYYKNHSEAKQYSTESNKAYARQTKEKVLEGYGSKCAYCGQDNPMYLCIDHVNDDGKEERSKGIHGLRLYLKIIRENFPRKYQVLCYNCNAAKEFFNYIPVIIHEM